MAESYVYDKAKYHYAGNYPEDLPEEQAFVHTGMFLGWILDHDLHDSDFWQDVARYVASFKSREMTGAQVYEYACDGVLLDEMLNAKGNSFAHDYFDFERGKYLQDYEELLVGGLPSTYHVEDTWENYEIIARRISSRYAEWKRTGA
jgi:hypothetical protein